MSHIDQSKIRNFCIIAHIDHGKSTLADRIIEKTGLLTDREMQNQVLDNMDLERERGITIKSQAVRMKYRAKDGNDYELNLIDTPGHVDFNYEVSRSLAACDGALLVVDASQGIEAQTLANVYLALDHDLDVMPVINKIDLPSADPDRVVEEIEDVIGIEAQDAPRISAKTGLNVEDVLEQIVEKIPAPQGDPDAPLQALIFDSLYDSYKGVIVFCRIKEGSVRVGTTIQMMATGAKADVVEVGYFGAGQFIPCDELSAGMVGYITASLKNVQDTRVGDTVTDARNVFVEVSASGIEPEEMEIAVVEIDGKWYLDSEGWDDGSKENYDDEDDEEEDDDDTWSDDEDDISSNAETSHTLENMKFSDAREFQDGLAFVRIHGKGESYKGFLDKKGKLKFYIPFDEDAIDADIYRYDVNFNNGYNWFVYDNIFYVIDTDGMIKSQYDADKVADYGGGYTWLEEEENVSWDDAGFWKYTLYSPEGGEVCDYTVSNQDLENLSFKRSYMGDGKFLYKKMDGTKEVCVLVEPELGKETELNVSFDKAEEHGMRDGLIIETGAMDDGYWAGDENPFHITVIGNGEEKEIEIPSQYLGPFGGYPTLLDWTKKYALFTVRQDDQDIYFLCDLETGDIKKYTGKYAPYFKYYSTTTSCIEDNVLALSMYGEDNQFYVCLINADTMKEIADPIAGESFSMEDKTLLIDQKELYDLSGNLLYTVEDGKKGELVSDGILQVTYSEEEKETVDGESEYVEVDKTDYYDLKGKKLFSEMDTADSKMVPEPSEEV